MGYRGKLLERQRARELRAESWTSKAIAEELGVAKSSVSLWVRDVEFTPRPVNGARPQRRDPNKLQRRKRQEIDALLAEGRRRVGASTSASSSLPVPRSMPAKGPRATAA